MGSLEFLSLPYQWGQRLDRWWHKATALGRPVISVGNIASGGRAKTPMVIALVTELKKRKMTPVVLTRGYGRIRRDPVWLDPSSIVHNMDAGDVGDEALEIFLKTGVYVLVGADRKENAQLFLKRYPKLPYVVFVLDDGFQHWALARDVDVVLYNDFDLSDSLIPVGRLREPKEALSRATVALKLGHDVRKISSMKADVRVYEKTLVLTTHVVDEAFLNFVRSRISAFEYVALKDHASSQEMLDVIEEHRPEQLVVGFKEAVKICSWPELQQLVRTGETQGSVLGTPCRILVVDCQVEFQDQAALWLKIFDNLS